MKTYHYVYKLTDPITKEFYYGSRTSTIEPELDDYIGSMQTWVPEDKSRLDKTIISQGFKTRESAMEAESILINEYINEELNRNYNIPNKGFHSYGAVTVKDKEGNTFQVKKDDPRYLSGELVHNLKGTVTVKDKDGKTFQVSKDDPRYLSGALVGYSKGMTIYKDKDGNKVQTNSNDNRVLIGELVGIVKGTVTVKDKDGNTFQVNKDDPNYLDGTYVGIGKGLIVARNKSGKIFNIEKDDTRLKTGELYIRGKRIRIKDKEGNAIRVYQNDPNYFKNK